MNIQNKYAQPVPAAIRQPLLSSPPVQFHRNPLSTERQLIEYLKNAYPNADYR